MKRKYVFIMLMLFFSINLSTFAQWTNVGSAGFTTSSANWTSLAFNSSTPYIAYSDAGSVYIMNYNGTNWVNVGSTINANEFPTVALNGTTPYVSLMDTTSKKAYVKMYNGTNWVNVGTPYLSGGTQGWVTMAFDGSTPYAAYNDASISAKAAVKKYDGTNWVNVGTNGFSAGDAEYISFAINNTTPYIAYQDQANSNRANVKRFDGTNWFDVGSPDFTAGQADWTSLAIIGTTPYIAYVDYANSNKVSVQKFDGTNWVYVGTAGFSSGSSNYVSLSYYGVTPFVVFQDASNNNKATVMYFNGTNWLTLGSAGFSAGTAIQTKLFINGSNAYVSYIDGANGNKASVMTYSIPTTPNAPFANTGTAITSNSFSANWNSVSGATGYYLDVATDLFFNNIINSYNNKNVNNVTNYSVSGLSANTTYYYRIRAYNISGTSLNSNVITVLTSASATPTLINGSSVGTFTIGDPNPIKIDSSIIVTAQDTTVIVNNAIIYIDSNFISVEDSLIYPVSLYGVSGSYDVSKGILRLSGASTVGKYQQILRSIQYKNSNTIANPCDKSFYFSLGDAVPFKDSDTTFFKTAHYYQYFQSPNIEWRTARDTANILKYYGLQGYLTTITSANENSFMFNKLKQVGWIGASDSVQVSHWKWATGPEAGINFYSGYGYSGGGGTPMNNMYSNWQLNQPDDYANVEFWAMFMADGMWNDYPHAAQVDGSWPQIMGYYVEYGGMASDPTVNVCGVKSIKLLQFPAPIATEATAITSTSFIANWESVSGASGYYLDLATDSNFTFFVSGYNNKNVYNVTSYTINGLNNDSTYYYRVKSYNSIVTSFNSNIIKVKRFPIITWTNPADIIYGTPLSATQLNATATIPGAFVYTPPSGTILNAGLGQTLLTTFTPTDTMDFIVVSKSVLINVIKATPVITWANPADIIYGTPLSATQLNATATILGTFVYTPASGTILNAGINQDLQATFTPTDISNYNIISKTVQINVYKASLTFTADDKIMTYNSALPTLTYNITGFVNSETSSVLSGTPSISTAANSSSDVGTYPIIITIGTLSATNYSFTFVNGTLTIGKANQTIDIIVIPTQCVGNIFYPGAVASSGLPVTYAVSPSTVAIVENNIKINVVGVGTATLLITQDGNIDWNPVSKTVSFDAKELKFPNFISPNGDGYNDTWSVPQDAAFLKDADVTIYDSYGQQLFKTTGFGSWDGTYNSKKCATGEYYYIVKCQDGVTYKGVILLMKN